jgi:hypothetical protein
MVSSVIGLFACQINYKCRAIVILIDTCSGAGHGGSCGEFVIILLLLLLLTYTVSPAVGT